MDVFRDGDRVGRDQIQWWVVFGHRLADELAVLISERDSRPEQVGALRAAPKIYSMAAGAIPFIETFPADQHVLRRELAGELREPAPAASATLATWLASSPLTGGGAAAFRRRRGGLCGGGLALRRWRSSTLREHDASQGGARKNDRSDQASLCSHEITATFFEGSERPEQRERRCPSGMSVGSSHRMTRIIATSRYVLARVQTYE
jgi:hypothetical protein